MTNPASSIRPIIQNQLNRCVVETELSSFGERYRGKVRDTYRTGDGRMIIVTTDRISAFDFVLSQAIPFKGQVLNEISNFFFADTKDVVTNHVMATPDPNVTIGKTCEVIPIEFVVRGYLVGHAWRVYRDGGRTLCGQPLPEGLQQNSRLPSPILTPSTKAQSGHDEDISADEILQQRIISKDLFEQLEAISLALFNRGTRTAEKRGLILVDTKYEFGHDREGNVVLVDEVHTPDSSRYFYLDTFASLFAANEPQRQLSKEFVREWLMDHGFQGLEGQTMPDLSDDFRVQVSERYIELYEMLTGRSFTPDTSPDPVARIRKALEGYFTG